MTDTGWRSVLTPEEALRLQVAEADWVRAGLVKKAASRERRTLYLRAKKRMARAQKGVDVGMEKA